MRTGTGMGLETDFVNILNATRSENDEPSFYEEKQLSPQQIWLKAIFPDPEEEARARYLVYTHTMPLDDSAPQPLHYVLGPAIEP